MESESPKPETLFYQAYKYEDQGKFKKAFDCLLSAARLEHTGSQINLGNFYSWGKGVKKDLKNAAYWYRRAYRNGDATGAYNLAIDRKKEGQTRSAVLWFNRALAMHYGEAVIQLAKIYMVRPSDKRRAIELLERTFSMSRNEISDDAKDEAAKLLSRLNK